MDRTKTYQSTLKSKRIAANPKLRDKMKSRMNEKKKKYGLGGLIGTGVGAGAGALLGNPMMGAQLGSMAGNAVEGAVTNDQGRQPQVRTTSGGSYGQMAQGGYMPMKGGYAQNLKQGGKAYGFEGRSHGAGGIDLNNQTEIEGNETMDTIGGKKYVFSDRVNIPGKKKSFAQRHKELMEQGASRGAIQALSKMQERVTGRDKMGGGQGGGQAEYQYGGFPNDPPLRPLQNPATGQFMSTGSNAPLKPQPALTGTVQSRTPGAESLRQANAARTTTYQTGKAPGKELARQKALGTRPSPRVIASKSRPPTSSALSKTTGVLRTGLGRLGGGALSILLSPEAVGDSSLGDRDIPRDIAFPNERQAEVEDSGDRNLGRVSMRGRGKYPEASNNPAPNDVIMDQDIDTRALPTTGYTSIARGIGSRAAPTAIPASNGNINLPSRATQKAGPAPEVRGANSGSAGGSGNFLKGAGAMALQMAPDAINMLTGVFGKDKTRKPTTIPATQIRRSYKGYNINPLLGKNVSNYRSILGDPSATRNQKLASQMVKQQGDQSAYAEKENRDSAAAMRYDMAQGSMDASRRSRQAGFNEQYRQDKMQSEANLGLSGNFARNSFANMSQKLLMAKREGNLSARDQEMLEMYRQVYGGI